MRSGAGAIRPSVPGIRRARLIAWMALALAMMCVASPAAAQGATAMNGDWREDVSCTAGPRPALRLYDAPVATADVPGCPRAHCVTLADGRRVCSCDGDPQEMRVGDGERDRWTTDFSVGGERFRVLEGNLDRDADDEIVVAQFRAVGNGLGIEHWRVTIVSDGRVRPLHVNVQDFSPHGSFVHPKAGGTCRLVATWWEPLRDARRGDGMYLIGYWMHYSNGVLRHDFTRPVVVRRLLTNFKARRPREAPFAWLRDGGEPRRRDHVAALPPFVGRVQGTIRSVSGDSISVELADGTITRYAPSGEAQPGGEDGSILTAWLVHAVYGRAYPPGYTGPAGWLDGTPVTVARYEEPGRSVHLLLVIR